MNVNSTTDVERTAHISNELIRAARLTGRTLNDVARAFNELGAAFAVLKEDEHSLQLVHASTLKRPWYRRGRW